MKRRLFFPHDGGAYNDIKLMKLRMRGGMISYGIYWFLLEYLYEQKKYRIRKSELQTLAKYFHINNSKLLSVVDDYDLFVTENGYLFSPGMVKRMKKYDKRCAELSGDQEEDEDEKVTVDEDKTLMDSEGILTKESNQLDDKEVQETKRDILIESNLNVNLKSNCNTTHTTPFTHPPTTTSIPFITTPIPSTTTSIPATPAPIPATAFVSSKPKAEVIEDFLNLFSPENQVLTPYLKWEECVDKAFQSQSWLEIIAMNDQSESPGGKDFLMNYKKEILEVFKQHIQRQGNEPGIHSVGNAKNYFANYYRAGTLTRATLEQKVLESQNTEDPYPFEEYNLATGERTICGIRVPPEAPPRPDSTSVWNSEWKEWRDF